MRQAYPLLVFLVLVPACAGVAPTPAGWIEVEGRPLRVVGNRAVGVEQIADVLAAAPTDDVETSVLSLYFDEGYATASVHLQGDELAISEGARFRVHSVTAEEVDDADHVVEPLGGAGALDRLLRVRGGEWFSRSSTLRDVDAVRRYYEGAGYPRALAVPLTSLDAESAMIDLRITVSRGGG